MNKIKQRIAIAETLGAVWLDVPPKEGYLYRPTRLLTFHKWEFDSVRCAPLPLPDKNGDAVCIPHYPDDLNEMREAERLILGPKIEWLDWYPVELTRAITEDYNKQNPKVRTIIAPWFADASQRARALLRTIGKWEDES